MQKTSYEVRISDWSSDVCSSDLQSVESSMLNQQLLLPYQAVAGMVFGGIKALLDPRIPKERQAAALLRLRRYAGLEPGTTPLTKLAEMRTQDRLRDKKLVDRKSGV